MPVALRDPRSSARTRSWLEANYRDWLVEIGASTEELAAASRQLAVLLSAPGNEAMVFARDQDLAGFALFRREAGVANAPHHVLLDFFVVPRMRRLGIGGEAARLLFDRFVGQWEISVLTSDVAAYAFWRRTLARYAPGQVTERREAGRVRQCFASSGAR
jgi:predicted acetyltransferase